VSSFEFTDAVCWGGRPVARRITDARPRRRLVVTGTIRGTETTIVGGSTSYACVLADGTGEIGLLFLGRQVIPGLVGGVRCTVEGTARMGDGRLVLWNPHYRIELCHGD
jgi:hypothetical protein